MCKRSPQHKATGKSDVTNFNSTALRTRPISLLAFHKGSEDICNWILFIPGVLFCVTQVLAQIVFKFVACVWNRTKVRKGTRHRVSENYVQVVICIQFSKAGQPLCRICEEWLPWRRHLHLINTEMDLGNTRLRIRQIRMILLGRKCPAKLFR